MLEIVLFEARYVHFFRGLRHFDILMTVSSSLRFILNLYAILSKK